MHQRRAVRFTAVGLLVSGFLVVGASGAGAQTLPVPVPLPAPPPVAAPVLPVPLPVDVPPEAPSLPAPAPAPAPSGDPSLPALPVDSPIPDAGLPAPGAAGGAPELPAGADPTSALAPVTGGADPSGQATGAACDAVAQVSAVPTQVGTTAFLAAAGKLPPSVTAALLPVLLAANSGGSGTDPTAQVCPQSTGGSTSGSGAGVGAQTVSTGSSPTGASAGGATTGANPTPAASGSSGSGGASLAFTGAMTLLLALVGLGLALTGGATLWARRLLRIP
jgi:hypothetical protein